METNTNIETIIPSWERERTDDELRIFIGSRAALLDDIEL